MLALKVQFIIELKLGQKEIIMIKLKYHKEFENQVKDLNLTTNLTYNTTIFVYKKIRLASSSKQESGLSNL